MKYRQATVSDVKNLVEPRKIQLIEEGLIPDTKIDDELTEYFSKHLQDKSLVEWLIEDNHNIIATGAIQFYEFPPSFRNTNGLRGYI